MKFSKKYFLALLLVLAIALAGCGGGTQAPAPGNQGEVPEPAPPAPSVGKTYIVGTEPTFAPFEYIDENTGEIVGFDIDLIKAIAEEAGIKVEIESLGFDGLIPGLQSGLIDVAIAGISVDPERAEAVDFGPNYFNACLMIAVAEGNDSIKSVEDLKGKKVAAQIGTTGALKAQELMDGGLVKEVTVYNTMDVVFMELQQGGVDAVINDLPVTEVYMKRNPGKVKMVGEPFEEEEYAYAVKKGNSELLEKLNNGLEKVKASGKFDELVIKHIAQ
ncbi:MAG: basic amino acid ABC transporter substrate-binding protein [Bacillota bacterium]